MPLAKKYGKNPRMIAEDIAKLLEQDNRFTNINIAGPGFINITLTDEYLSELMNKISSDLNTNIDKEQPKKIVLDYVIDDFPLTYNAKSNFSVWTDFEINNSIAPKAKTIDNRHRCESSEIYRASDNLEDIIIAFNEQGKIIYMAERTGFGYGSPSDIFYHNKIETIKQLDCFNILDSYIPFVRDMYPHHYHDYEFIIPKNGFVITGNLKSESFVSFMKFILGDVCDVHSELFSITNNMRICKNYFQEGQLDFIKCSCLENKTNLLASKNMNVIHRPNVLSLEEKVDELNKRLINIEKILKKLENN
jgi:hypothetical protein